MILLSKCINVAVHHKVVVKSALVHFLFFTDSERTQSNNQNDTSTSSIGHLEVKLQFTEVHSFHTREPRKIDLLTCRAKCKMPTLRPVCGGRPHMCIHVEALHEVEMMTMILLFFTIKCSWQVTTDLIFLLFFYNTTHCFSLSFVKQLVSQLPRVQH